MAEVDGHARRYGTGGERLPPAARGRGRRGRGRRRAVRRPHGRRARARGWRWSADRRSLRRRPSGRRAGSPRRWRTTTRPSCTSRTRSPPAARPRAPARCGCCARSRPARVRDLERLGVSFDADRHGNLALGLEGGHSRRRIVHAGGSATGRRITRELSALAATHERIDVLEPRAATLADHARRPLRRPGRAPARRRRAPRRWPARSCSPPAAWPRSGSAPPTRAARSAPGCALAQAAGAALADLEFMQFHPTALRRDGAARRLPDHRGRARRGRDPARRRRRALRRRAGAARPGGARDPGRARAQRRRPR